MQGRFRIRLCEPQKKICAYLRLNQFSISENAVTTQYCTNKFSTALCGGDKGNVFEKALDQVLTKRFRHTGNEPEKIVLRRRTQRPPPLPNRTRSLALIRKIRIPTRANLDFAAYAENVVLYDSAKASVKPSKAATKPADLNFENLFIPKTIVNSLKKLPIPETVFIGVAFMEVSVILVAKALDCVPVVSHKLFFSFLASG